MSTPSPPAVLSPAGSTTMLSPDMSTSASASASSFTSPIQSATSPRLMPSKSRPTTALVFGQQAETLQPHLLPPPLQDTESLSSDDFVLSASSGSSAPTGAAAAGGENHSKTPSARSGLKTMPGTSNQDDQSSESSDDADGRLTDTESEQVRARTRTGTPVIAGRSNNHHHGTTEHGTTTSSALQSLREIEEHDHEGRQTQLQGLESRFRTTTLAAQDQDLTSEGGDSTTESDTQPKSAMDPAQIQGKLVQMMTSFLAWYQLKVLRPKPSNNSVGNNSVSSRPKSRLQRTASMKSYDSDDISNNHGGYQKHYGDEDHTTSAWTEHRKHFFILSSAGKPIYARYGDESRISSYMGVIQALISFFADNDDTIRCINAGEHRFVFLLKAPLYLVCVSRSGESESQLRDQLGYLYAQIISVLTQSQMTRIFEQRNNFDLRGLIGGTEIFLDSLGKLMNTYPGFMIGAIQCLTMPRELRDKVGAVLGRAKCKPLLYALLVTPTQLITLLRPRTHSMHPADLHLIFNLLSGSTTFESSESWTPICLPKFNNKSFLHAYICYIAKKVCMLLISPDKDSFFEMSNVKQKVVEGLEAGGMLAALENYAAAGTRGGFSVGDTGIPGLRHFLYKSRTNVQFTMPELTEPYATTSARKRLLRQYQNMNERMHRKTRPLKLLFHVGEQETMLGWITSGFELYAAFGPLVSKSAVVLMSNKLLKWIRKQEDSLLILNSPSFEKFK
ncbi:Vacuolar fusion protein mon1b [Linnemannia schmuckeri]|uniref:Vacuolar fusion protein MON1 n=1 Tax=Linnemannia schmuckeri TaxID=64567 RepID=A0A9P5S4H9_9FUNG|nr:Vacuolar fusion protein mon1b [Linnemannia schmuckeri]